jgi:AraC family ethanolamine operon transcriptional activator
MSSDFSCLADLTTDAAQDNFSHQVTDDFDEQASYLQGWNQNYAQVSAGHFKGFISEVHLGDVSLFWEFTSQRLYQYGILNDDTIAIGVPLNSIENGMFCGAPCEQNTVHVYSGKEGFEFISPQNLLIGLIVVNRHKLMQLLNADDQYFLNLKCKQAHISKISFHAYLNLVNFLKSTINILKSQPALTKNLHFSDELSASAIQLVTDSLLNNTQSEQNAFLNKSWKILADTREIVNLRQDNPITVAELCESLSMSRRSLQYHFEQAINTSPVAYLRAARLNGVRQMLKTANSVTEAATHWGFWHFGHFSHEYKKMFGELPSATFKRIHGSHYS